MASYAKLAAVCLVICAQQAIALPRVDPELLHAQLTFKEWDEVMKTAEAEAAPSAKSKETEPVPEAKPDAEGGRPSSAEAPAAPVNEIKESPEEKRRLARLLPAPGPAGKDGRPTMSLSQFLRLSPFVKRAMQTNRQPLRFG